MKSLLQLALAVLFLLTPFLLPAVPAARQGAELAYEPLLAPAPHGPSIAERVLAGPAATRAEDGSVSLKLHGVRYTAPPEENVDFLLLHGVARAAIAKGLRRAAKKEDLKLAIVGEEMPGRETSGGAGFLVEYTGSELRVTYAVDGTPEVQFVNAIPWGAPSRASILPPWIALAVAAVARRRLVALLAALFAAAWLAWNSPAGYSGQTLGVPIAIVLALAVAWRPSKGHKESPASERS